MGAPVSPQGQGVAELVERLRRRELTPSKYGGFSLINPNGPEAAALLERYHAALEQLVAACEQRRVQDFDPASPITVIETRTADILDFHDALDIARATLGQTGEATE